MFFFRKQNGISSSKTQTAPEFILKHGFMDGTVNKPQCSLKLEPAKFHIMLHNRTVDFHFFYILQSECFFSAHSKKSN